MKAVHKIFGANAARKSYCAIGSVKSMIGHTQAASGIAGLIKVALALHNKVLPPTLNVRKASSKINWENSPCYINDKARPWKKPEHDHLRRAAVSAFGFGGVNAHAVLEEFPSESGATQTAQAIPAKGKSRAIKLSLRFPELSAQSVDTSIQMPSTPRVGEKPIPVSAIMPAHRSSSSIQSVQAIPGTQEHPETVLSGYFQALGEFQKRLLSTQEAVIDNYLSDPGNE
jgi:hypothetical protein